MTETSQQKTDSDPNLVCFGTDDACIRESSALQRITRIANGLCYAFFGFSWLAFYFPSTVFHPVLSISFGFQFAGCLVWGIGTLLQLICDKRSSKPLSEAERKLLVHENISAWISVVGGLSIILAMVIPFVGQLALLAGVLLYVVSNLIFLDVENKRVNLPMPAGYNILQQQLLKKQRIAYRNAIIFITCVSLFFAGVVVSSMIFPPAISLFGLILIHAYPLQSLVILLLRTAAIGFLMQNTYYSIQLTNQSNQIKPLASRKPWYSFMTSKNSSRELSAVVIPSPSI